MGEPSKEDFLKVPSVRKSYAVIKEMMKAQAATPSSESMADSYAKRYFEKFHKSTPQENDSSLGLLDMDNFKGIDEDSTPKPSRLSIKPSEDSKPLSFDPRDFTGRSTGNGPFAENDSKENKNPNMSFSENDFGSINEFIEQARRQSAIVDDILMTSNDPSVCKNRELLKSFRKESIAKWDRHKVNESWNYCSEDLDLSKGSAKMRNESFPIKKLDVSKAELSWIKEKGELPVYPNHNLTATIDKSSFPDCYENNISRSNAPSEGEMSMGNYFEERCVDLKDIFGNKTNSQPSESTKSFPLNESTPVISKTKTDQHLKSEVKNETSNTKRLFQDTKPIMEDSIGEITEDTISASAFSLTRIRDILGNVDSESPSAIIDNILGLNKQENRLDTKSSRKLNMNSKKPDISALDNSMDSKVSIDYNSIFHSTQNENWRKDFKDMNDDAFQNNTFLEKLKSKRFLESSMNFSPIADQKLLKKIISANAVSIPQDENSTLKNSKSNNTGSTNTTTKSANTVICGQTTNMLNTIKEDPIVDNKTLKSTTVQDIKLDEMSPGIKSADRSCYSFSSDVSKEIKNIMSPASCDAEPSLKTPPSGRHIKRLTDHFQSRADSEDDWISPSKAKIGDSGKERISPKSLQEHNSISVQNKSQNVQANMNSQNVIETKRNNTQKDNWIKIESRPKNVLVGISSDVDLKLKSLYTGWMAVNFSVHSVSIDGQVYKDDIGNVLVIQVPDAKILLKSESEMECLLKLVTLMVDKKIEIILQANMKDIVTQRESDAKHRIKLVSESPNLCSQSVDGAPIEIIEFPTVPHDCEHSLLFLLWNDSETDLPLKFDISNDDTNSFHIANAELIFGDQLQNTMSSNSTVNQSVKSAVTNKSFLLPGERKAALLFTVVFNPKKSKDDSIEKVSASLNVYLIPALNNRNDCLLVKEIRIDGKTAMSSLLIKNSQKSDILVIPQGGTEDVIMLNAGTMKMNYKLYFALPNSEESCVDLTPCDRNIFVLNKSDVSLKQGEKATVKIAHPLSTMVDEIKRLLVFESPYTTEVITIIGTPQTSRCSSQQSICSVDTASQETVIKSTKKELSWGSLKMSETKIQEITLKNTSSNRKLRTIVSVKGDCFKVISDNGPATSLFFTLQPQECRALHVEFKPTREGGHLGALKVARRHNSNVIDFNKSIVLCRIPLHGFCGQSVLIFRDGVFRHAGAQGLPLGPLHDSGLAKEINFTIWNKGTTTGFALFDIQLKWKYRSLGNDVQVNPRRLIIKPGDTERCTVTVPRKALSLARGQQDDTEVVASMVVFHGDESNRLRIKKIYNETKSKSVDDIALSAKVSQESLKRLCETFQGEDCNYGNVSKFKETSSVLKTLLDELQQKEVLITYDINLDYSIAQLSSELDDTLQFHTVCEDGSADTTLM